jgi:biotin operon repressor
MSTSRKTLAAVTVGAVALASTAYAVGSTSGDGSAFALGGGGGGQTASASDPWIENLASKMGVEPSKLATALTAVKKEQEPKGDIKSDSAKVLATELGVSQDKVEDALKELRPARPGGPGGPGDGPHVRIAGDFIADLAKELGISEAKVKATFEKFKPEPPTPGSEPKPPTPPDLGEIAKELGVSEAKLKEALEKVRPRLGGRGERKMRVHPGGPGGPGRGGRAFGADDIAADLAKKLGVSEAKVNAALEKVRETAVQRAQERHDALVKSLADKLGISVEKVQSALGSVPGRGGFGFRGHHGP